MNLDNWTRCNKYNLIKLRELLVNRFLKSELNCQLKTNNFYWYHFQSYLTHKSGETLESS